MRRIGSRRGLTMEKLLGAALTLWATASPVAADTTIVCPTGPTCVETGGWGCLGVRIVWEEGLCGCGTSNLFYITCSGAGITGSLPCPGGSTEACTLLTACTATPEYGQPCQVVEPPSLVCGSEAPGGSSGSGGSRPAANAPPGAGGKPVSLTTGAMFFTHTDAVVGELSVTRSFNSARVSQATRYGSFGPGWNASFDVRLNVLAANTIEARLSDGSPQYYFDDNGDGVFQSVLTYSTQSWIETVSGGYKRAFRGGGYETYDTTGKLVSVTDEAGVVTTYSRDGQGRLSSLSRRGRSISLAYSGSLARPAQILGPSGAELASYTYDANNRLEQVTYPDGSGYRYVYDSAGRVQSVTDLADKMIEAHAYDASGKAETSEIGNGVDKLTFLYGANQTTVTDALGNVTTYEFTNVRGTRRVTRITGPCSSCGGGFGDVQEWTYDEFGNITSYRDGSGKTWTYTYSASNDLVTETDPLNHLTTYAYDSQGRVLSRTGPDGSITTYTYGPGGPLTITESVTPGQTRTTSIAYTPQGQPETITDPRGKSTLLAYGPTGDLASVRDPLNHTTSFGYDSLGRRITVTDPLGHTTTTAYGVGGRVTRLASPDGSWT